MYENIGGKLKITAKLLMTAAVLGSVAIAVYLTAKELVPLTAAAAIVIGVPFAAWFLTALLYGFGELIEKTAEIAYNTRGGESPVPRKTAAVQTSDRQKRDILETWYTEGLIDEEEYRRKLREIDG